MNTAIDAQALSKRFILHHSRTHTLKERFLELARRRTPQSEEFWALRDVSVKIGQGEAVGLVGRNGSGKSTFLKLVAGIHRPTSGALRVPHAARIGTMIELGVGFHGELSGRENVFLNAAIHGLSREATEAIYERVVEYSGLGHFMDVPIKNFSSGMHMRLGFAISANLDPDILLLDEIFAVGDADFQQQCMRTMGGFGERGKTIVFVSHALDSVKAICQRVCVLDRGRLLFDGRAEEGLGRYRRLVAASAEPRPVGAQAPDRAAKAAEADRDQSWHRQAVGGQWEAAGDWQFDFLRRQGLKPSQFILDVGCGSLAGARHLLPFMEQSHYWGFEINRALFAAGVTVELARVGIAPERGHFVVDDGFDLSGVPARFDIAIANSFFQRLTFNRVARCIASVMRVLEPDGRFFVSWFDNPDPACFDPLPRPGGMTSYPDAEPYHYPFEVLAGLCATLGLRAERVDGESHPRGDAVMVIRKGVA